MADVFIKFADSGLPVILRGKNLIYSHNLCSRIVKSLEVGYFRYYNSRPSDEQVNAWKGFVKSFVDEIRGLDLYALLEYPVLNGASRVDALLVGRKKLLVIEAKGWRKLPKRYENNEILVLSDEGINIDPCLQAQSYANKLSIFYPEIAESFTIEPVVYYYNIYNINSGALGGSCKVTGRGDLRKFISKIEPPAHRDLVTLLKSEINLRPFISELPKIIGSSKDLIEVITKILRGPYGLIREQSTIIEYILKILYQSKKDDKKYLVLIEGPGGSGKTIVALSLFLIALNSGYSAVLGYRNSRLLKTIRHIMRGILYQRKRPIEIIELIKYSAVGMKGRYSGLCEEMHNYRQYGGELDLMVLDEAQRLPKKIAKKCSSKQVRVIVAFYDENQSLSEDEMNSVKALKESAIKQGRVIKEMKLPIPVRVSENVLRFIKGVLFAQEYEECVDLGEFKVFIHKNLRSLRESLIKAYEAGRRVALICSFTETKGDMKNRLSWRSPQNIRIKEKDFVIKWLMDDEKEYAYYWNGDFHALSRVYKKYGGPDKVTPADVCASVYGAQGFDAEVVGVIWGKDLIYRYGVPFVNSQAITDYIGKQHSLLNISRKPGGYKTALALLLNRYYIMLTRATKELHIYFEDKETFEYVTKRMNTISCNGVKVV